MKGRSCVCMTNILHTMKTYAVCQQKTKNKQKCLNNLFAYKSTSTIIKLLKIWYFDYYSH